MKDGHQSLFAPLKYWVEYWFYRTTQAFENSISYSTSARGFIKFLCRRSVGFFSRAFLVFLMKESQKRRWKQLGKLKAKSRSAQCSALNEAPGWLWLVVFDQCFFGAEKLSPMTQTCTIVNFHNLHSLLGLFGSFVFEQTESSDWCWSVVKK